MQHWAAHTVVDLTGVVRALRLGTVWLYYGMGRPLYRASKPSICTYISYPLPTLEPQRLCTAHYIVSDFSLK